MDNKKGMNWFFAFIAIILGWTIYKQFNENLKFDKPWIIIVYIVTFIVSIFFLIKDYKNRSKK